MATRSILQVFNITKVGKVAGLPRPRKACVERGAGVRLLRDNVVIHEGKLSTLKRFKDEVKEVQVRSGVRHGLRVVTRTCARATSDRVLPRRRRSSGRSRSDMTAARSEKVNAPEGPGGVRPATRKRRPVRSRTGAVRALYLSGTGPAPGATRACAGRRWRRSRALPGQTSASNSLARGDDARSTSSRSTTYIVTIADDADGVPTSSCATEVLCADRMPIPAMKVGGGRRLFGASGVARRDRSGRPVSLDLNIRSGTAGRPPAETNDAMIRLRTRPPQDPMP